MFSNLLAGRVALAGVGVWWQGGVRAVGVAVNEPDLGPAWVFKTANPCLIMKPDTACADTDLAALACMVCHSPAVAVIAVLKGVVQALLR